MSIRKKSSIIKIPVKLINGRWEFFFGGEVPVRDGAVADLLLETSALTDEQFIADVTKPLLVKVLTAGTELRVAVTFKDGVPSGSGPLKPYIPMGRSLSGLGFGEMRIGDYEFVKQSTYFFPVWIGDPTLGQKENGEKEGGVWLSIKGFDVSGLISSTIKADAIGNEPLSSLNHALTKFSEKFETWRISHTGNVYQSFYYLEGDGSWYPLEYLRNRELAKAELSVVSELWSHVATKMKLPYSGKPKTLKLK